MCIVVYYANPTHKTWEQLGNPAVLVETDSESGTSSGVTWQAAFSPSLLCSDEGQGKPRCGVGIIGPSHCQDPAKNNMLIVS